MDDIGGGSDFEDYFGKGKQNLKSNGIEQEDEVLDEEIVVVKPQSLRRNQLDIRLNAP